MATNPQSFLLLGDIGIFGFKSVFDDYPSRVLNLGIAEQSSISIAAGLAKEGYYPIFHTIAPFIVDRAYEQIKVDFGYSKQKGLLVSVGASFDYGKLGGTHHCPEDIALISTIEGMNIYLPGNKMELDLQLREILTDRELAYLRIELQEHTNSSPLENGTQINFGTSGTLIAVSYTLNEGLRVASELKMNLLYLNQIKSSSLKPFDVFDDDVVILEPFMLGSTKAALERSGTRFKGRVESFGFPRDFRRKYVDNKQHHIDAGLDAESIIRKIISK